MRPEVAVSLKMLLQYYRTEILRTWPRSGQRRCRERAESPSGISLSLVIGDRLDVGGEEGFSL